MNIYSDYIGLLIISLFLTSCTHKVSNKNKNKNVLFIMVDDLRPELGAYGATQIKSPNIDRLASEGALFKRAFAQIPVCGPSRVSLLTGLRIDSKPWDTKKLKQSFISLPKYFKNNGYQAVSLGKIFHHMHDRARDWSEAPWRSEKIYYGKEDWAHYNTYHEWQDKNSAHYVNSKTGRGPYYEHADVPDTAYQDGKLARKAISKLRALKKRKQPFFLAVGFWRPHLPLNAPQKYWDMYDSTQIVLADNRFRPKNLPDEVTNSREILQYARTNGWPDSVGFHYTTRHAYYACVSYVDRQIGKVLKTLDKLDLSENTIVVLLGDHGWHLGEHNFWGKHNLLYNATHAPLIIKSPDYSHKSISKIVEFLDIYPTLCDLAGLSKPDHLDGKSLVPLIGNDKASSRYWPNSAYVTWNGGRNIITDRYSYTEWTDSDSQMLFNHQADPEENANVVGEYKYKGLADSLSNLLHEQFSKDFNSQ